MESVDASVKQESSSKDMAQSIASFHSAPSKSPTEPTAHSAHEAKYLASQGIARPRDKDQDGQQRDYSRRGVESCKQLQQPHDYCCGRERLKRHRTEVAGRVMIPDTWGQENFLRDWIEYSTFDALLEPKGISSAREALMAEGQQRAASQRLRIESRC
ncbi:protein BIC1 [Punica granatum]|uniref:Protein BIC1 n=1 Tax=Punica granatum TaxID=22663 RepID=A0A218WLI0_PUNGR|nr:protein BIC1 [Punica granatum]OWM73655.1 hypothetical protein CDL15_Pgr026754 [Punica granatum]